ncbi:hypothetical protein ABK040_002627 [Willaertia magna]
MKLFITFLLLLSFIIITVYGDKLIQVQVLSRHCDRSPVSNFDIPADPWDWQSYLARYSYGAGEDSKAIIGVGELTSLGIAQCYQIGTQFRKRYLSKYLEGTNEVNPTSIDDLLFSTRDENNINTAHYTAQDFKFYSTGVDRTLVSVFSISQGMFPQYSGPIIDINFPNSNQNYSLPSGIQPVPIFTETKNNDVWMSAYANCPEIDLRLEEQKHTEEYNNLVKKYQNLIDRVVNETNFNSLVTGNVIEPVAFYKLIEYTAQLQSRVSKEITFDSFYILFDLLFVQKSHNKLNIKWINDHWDEIEEMAGISTFQTFNRKIQGNLGAGPLMKKILFEMQKLVKSKICSSCDQSNGDNCDVCHKMEKPLYEDSNFENTKPFKYVHYSAHDVTILSLLATLGLSEDYSILQKLPPYGSQLIFELYENTTTSDSSANNYYVKIIVNRGFGDTNFTSYKLISLGGTGCDENCAFPQFEDVVIRGAIPKNWCDKCNNKDADICVRELYEEKRSLTTLLLIFLPILGGINVLAFGCLCLVGIRMIRKKNQENGNREETEHIIQRQ